MKINFRLTTAQKIQAVQLARHIKPLTVKQYIVIKRIKIKNS